MIATTAEADPSPRLTTFVDAALARVAAWMAVPAPRAWSGARARRGSSDIDVALAIGLAFPILAALPPSALSGLTPGENGLGAPSTIGALAAFVAAQLYRAHGDGRLLALAGVLSGLCAPPPLTLAPLAFAIGGGAISFAVVVWTTIVLIAPAPIFNARAETLFEAMAVAVLAGATAFVVLQLVGRIGRRRRARLWARRSCARLATAVATCLLGFLVWAFGVRGLALDDMLDGVVVVSAVLVVALLAAALAADEARARLHGVLRRRTPAMRRVVDAAIAALTLSALIVVLAEGVPFERTAATPAALPFAALAAAATTFVGWRIAIRFSAAASRTGRVAALIWSGVHAASALAVGLAGLLAFMLSVAAIEDRQGHAVLNFGRLFAELAEAPHAGWSAYVLLAAPLWMAASQIWAALFDVAARPTTGYGVLFALAAALGVATCAVAAPAWGGALHRIAADVAAFHGCGFVDADRDRLWLAAELCPPR